MSLFGTKKSSSENIQQGITMLAEAVRIISKEKSTIIASVDKLNEVIDIIIKHAKGIKGRKAKKAVSNVADSVIAMVKMAEQMSKLSKIRISAKVVVKNIEAMEACIDQVLDFVKKTSKKLTGKDFVFSIAKLSVVVMVLTVLAIVLIPLLLVAAGGVLLMIYIVKKISAQLKGYDLSALTKDLVVIKAIFEIFIKILFDLIDIKLKDLILTLIKLGPIYLIFVFFEKLIGKLVALNDKYGADKFQQVLQFLSSVIVGILTPVKKYIIEYIDEISIKTLLQLIVKYFILMGVIKVLDMFIQVLVNELEKRPEGILLAIARWMAEVITFIIIPFKKYIVDLINSSKVTDYIAVMIKLLLMNIIVVEVTLFLSVIQKQTDKISKEDIAIISAWIAGATTIIYGFVTYAIKPIVNTKLMSIILCIIKMMMLTALVKSINTFFNSILEHIEDEQETAIEMAIVSAWVGLTAGIILAFKKLILDQIIDITFADIVKSILKLIALNIFLGRLRKFMKKIDELSDNMNLIDIAIDMWIIGKIILGYFFKFIFNPISMLKVWDIKKTIKKTKKLTKFARKLLLLLIAIEALSTEASFITPTLSQLGMAAVIIVGMLLLVFLIKHTPTRRVKSKIKKLIRITYSLRRLLKKIVAMTVWGPTDAVKGHVPGTPIADIKAMISVLLALILITLLVRLIKTIVLITPFILIFVIASPLIMIGIILLGLVLKLMVQVMFRLAKDPKTRIAMEMMALTATSLVAIALAFVAIGAAAANVLYYAQPLLAFLGIILAYLLFLTIFGFISKLIMPLIAASTAAFLAMIASVEALDKIAKVFKRIEKLDLNYALIEKNIGNLFKLIGLIQLWLFAPPESEYAPSRQHDRSIPGMLAEAGLRLVGSLLATPVLIQSIIAVFSVLLIGWMLRALQLLKLDGARIKQNVKVVLSTVNFIISKVFQPDDEKMEESGRKEQAGIFDRIDQGLRKIVEALASTAYLFLMIIAVGAILILSGLLGLLQLVHLDKSRILENVDSILSTCAHIIANVFEPEEKSNPKSKRGLFMGIIRWALGDGIANILQAIFTVAYLALMIIAIVLILAIGGLLILVAKLDEETINKAKERAKTILETAQSIINNVFYNEDKDTPWSNRGILLTLIRFFFGKEFADVVAALLTIAYLFMVMIAVCMIEIIASRLKSIADIDKDTILTAKERAKSVLEAAQEMMTLVCGGLKSYNNSQSFSDKGILGTLLSWVSPELAAIVDALLSLMGLAIIELAIGAIHKIATEMKEIAEIEVDPAKAQATARLAIEGAGQILLALTTLPSGVDDDALEKFEETFGRISNIVTSIKTMNENFMAIKDIAEISDKDKEAIVKKASGAMATAILIANTLLGWDTYNAAIKADKDQGIIGGIMTKIANKIGQGDKAKQMAANISENERLDKVRAAVEKRIEGIAWKFEQVKVVTELMSSLTTNIATSVEAVSKLKDLKIPDAKTIVSNVQGITDVVDQVVAALLDIDTGDGRKIKDLKLTDQISYINDRKKIIDKTSELVESYGDLSNALGEIIESFNKIDPTNNTSKLKTLGDVVDKYIEIHGKLSQSLTTKQKTDFADRIKAIRDINRYVGDIKVSDKDVENLGKQTDNYIRFFEKVDQMKMANLNKATELMKYWAAIARSVKGDFNKLAEAINEHVYPAITTLNETMDGVKKSQDKIFEELTKDVNINIAGAGGAMETPSSPGGTPSESVSTGGVGDLNDSTDSPFPARKPQSGSIGDLPMEGDAIKVYIVNKKFKP